MKLPALVALALSLAAGFACSTAPASAPRPGYTLVFLKTGPADAEITGEERKTAFAGHMSNIGRMAEERQLVVAGPFGETRHDPLLRGLFVMNTGDRAQATAWASTDPTAMRGMFVLEYHDLATDAPLLAALERDLDAEAQATKEGRTVPMGEGMRGYALLTAEHGDVARRELGPLLADGRVFLLADLDGTRALALLDAKNVADAQARFADVLPRLGAHALDDWLGSSQLAHLRAP
jgi:uncharacterized protein YciI